MNSEKAKEFFSAYAEGTLDASLTQSLEQRLRADSALMAEFRDFRETIEELDTLKFQPVEIPFDLNERISAKLDRHIYEQKQTKAPAWNLWARNVAFAGLAAAAVFGAIVGINARGAANISGIPAPLDPVNQLTVSALDNGVALQYRPSVERTLSVRSGTSGALLREFKIGSGGWANNLQNKQPEPALFDVSIQGEDPATLIAVPGVRPFRVAEGEGSLKEFARSLAGFYHVPVVLKSSGAGETVKWSFSDTDPVAAAAKVLDSQRFSVESRTSGVLWIQGND
jgi:hypothetical protein